MSRSTCIKDRGVITGCIKEVADWRSPVQVTMGDRIKIGNCRLIPGTERGDSLYIKVRAGDYPEAAQVGVTCILLKTLYTFKSKLLSRTEVDPDHVLLEIQVPGEIFKEERRQYYRIRPSLDRPVKVTLNLRDNRTIFLEAMDIGGGGISFCAPHDLYEFEAGDAFFLDISLPHVGGVRLLGAIRNVSRLLNVVRVGLAFADMSLKDHNQIIDYVAHREREMREEVRVNSAIRKPRICVIDQSGKYDGYRFLDKKFDVTKMDFFNVILRMTANPPELITLACGNAESASFLQVVGRHRTLKNVPIIMLSREDLPETDIPENAVAFVVPFNETLFLGTAEDLVEKYRIAKRIEKKKSSMISGAGKILVIDRFHNFGAKNMQSLIERGFEVSVSTEEENIFVQMEHGYPDLILFDEETQKTDPVSLCKIMNLNKAVRDIPKVILTSDERNFDRFYSQGLFADFLLKPVRPEKMVSKVFEVLCR